MDVKIKDYLSGLEMGEVQEFGGMAVIPILFQKMGMGLNISP